MRLGPEDTMKVARDGRIILWDGGSLWGFDVPSRPDGAPSTRMHAHHALQLTLSAGGQFSIRTEDARTPGPLVLVAPDTPHAFEPEGRIALLFVEPESRAGRALLSEMNGAPVARLEPERLPDAVRELGVFWVEPRAPDEAVAAAGQGMLDRLLGSVPPTSSLDRRIARAIEWILPRIEEPLTLSQAADVACLSESRFSHLFAEETGLPFRTWVLWRRLMRSVERMAAGETLTSAALQAGFSDSAHFSRTFLRMFGVQASALGLV
jgi:AraC-like DNA-binding protein